MPWATVWSNVYLPLRLEGIGKARRRPARRRRRSRMVGLERHRARLSARAFRRHEDAGLDRARARHRAARPADGRAVRGARRDHPLPPQRRPFAPVAVAQLDRGVRDPQRVRIGLSVEPHRGDGGEPGACRRRGPDRGTLSARRGVPHLAALQPVLPRGPGAGCTRRWTADGEQPFRAIRRRGAGDRHGPAAPEPRAAPRAHRPHRGAARDRLPGAGGVGGDRRDLRHPALHPAGPEPGAPQPDRRLGHAVPLAPGDLADHPDGALRRHDRRRGARDPVHDLEVDRAQLLPVRRDPAGDADHLDRAPDPDLCRQRLSGAPDLRLDRRLLPDPLQHHARA